MISGYKVSKHLIDDRMGRLEKIASTTGFGEIEYKLELKENDCIGAITSTGVFCVIDPTDSIIITMYLLNVSKAKALFGDHIPDKLYHTLMKNLQKGYTTL